MNNKTILQQLKSSEFSKVFWISWILSMIGAFLGGLCGPIIMYFKQKRKKDFVA